MKNTILSAIVPLVMAAGQTQAASAYSMIVSTAEGVGAFNSTLSGTSVQTFDSLLGYNTNVVWDGVGLGRIYAGWRVHDGDVSRQAPRDYQERDRAFHDDSEHGDSPRL